MSKKIVISVLILIVLIAGFFIIRGIGDSEETQEVSMDSPVATVVQFYDSWIAAREKDESTFDKDLVNLEILSKEIRDNLNNLRGKLETGVDPITCQEALPTGFSNRYIYELEDEVQILVTSIDAGLDRQAVVTLKKLNEGWYINEIECSAGDVGEEREFSFEREGLLIKDVPAPYNSNNWHIVFEENNELGIVPISFNGESTCVNSEGVESTCSPNELTAQSQIKVFGELGETGALVKRMEIK